MTKNSNLKLPIFKVESFGAADGPGIRLVIFSQGCLYRCLYCHNPESWDLKKETEFITIKEIIAKYEHNKAFYRNGGITLSGGDPLIHLDFVIAMAKECDQRKISLALDTSAVNFCKQTEKKYLEICKYNPLWIVDIKQINKAKHKKLTGVEEQREINLIKFLEKNNQKYWVRRVLVPEWTDDPKDLVQLGKFISTLKNIQYFQILPFHQLAKTKYERLHLDYPLSKIKPATQEDVKTAVKYIQEGYSE